jgi:hypothetical protein
MFHILIKGPFPMRGRGPIRVGDYVFELQDPQKSKLTKAWGRVRDIRCDERFHRGRRILLETFDPPAQEYWIEEVNAARMKPDEIERAMNKTKRQSTKPV